MRRIEAGRLARKARWVEAREQVGRQELLAGVRHPERVSEEADRPCRRLAAVRERDRAVTLREPLPVGAEHQRHVRVTRLGQPKQALEEQLARRGHGEVRAADDLADSLVGVVDHHGDVVGRSAVAALEDEVVDARSYRAEQQVLELEADVGGPETESSGGSGPFPLAAAEVAARAGVGPLGQMWRRGRFPDLAPAAIARVGVEPGDRLPVQRQTLRLPLHAPVPVEADRREIVDLVALPLGPRAALVEILDAEDEAGSLRAREEPGEQCRAQVPEVERTGWARCEAAVVGHTPILSRPSGYGGHMARKLDEYEAKRSFESTPEPSGSEREGGDRRRFVIQEHSARRLHWDLRLEHDGVALSWAVPNGIPEDPTDNRLAVHTEDHPLEYLDFEGDIPAGNYGAGTMRIWDRGTYELHKLESQELLVTFHGARVEGRYALFQTSKDGKNWMIHRMDPPVDPGREPFPERIEPMLARLGDFPRDEAAHAFEVKWDGVRALCFWQPGHFRLQGRRTNEITAQYPELRALGRALGSREAVLDGEIVALDERGRPSFERLQRRMHVTSEGQIRRLAAAVPVTYMIFDVLYAEGRSLLDRPYAERRERLDALELRDTRWRTPPSYAGEGRSLLRASEEQGLEGVVAKRLDSCYEPGRRSGAWIKLKNKRSIELVVGGWMPGEGHRQQRIGALLLGYHDAGGTFRYAGRAGSGLSEEELDYMRDVLAPLERSGSPFSSPPRPPRGAVFVEPQLVVEVEFSEWTRERILRHPVYKGRRDTDPKRIVIDETQPVAPDAAEGPPGDEPPIETVRELPRGAVEVEVEGRRLRLSNRDKVLYRQAGFTKGQLIDYYARIAPVLLPHLRGRPLTLKRYPDGVEGQFFYEKQCPAHRPEWVRTHPVYSRRNGRDINFCLAEDLATLVWLGNLADIELHTSMSLAAEIDRPTMMVFDLDPGPPATIVECSRVALWLRELFDPLSLESFPKTSGSKGMQVYVPLNTPVTYDDTKPFAKAVAELAEKQHPDLVVSRMTKELRAGKVLVDWSQNDEHKTTVCVYSLRARERPTASTPLRWTEVERCAETGDPDLLSFDHADVLGRVDRDGDLFSGTLTIEQTLPLRGQG